MILLCLYLQKRKRKQHDLNTGELDAHIYHEKVTWQFSFCISYINKTLL